MAARRLPTCCHCGRRFKPCVYNRHHQTWCPRPECRLARDRARKRKHYRHRSAHDPGFRESERARCRESMRRSRLKEGDGIRSVPVTPASGELLAGLVSQLAGTTDPQVVAGMMDAYAQRGRRLAVLSRIRGSPGH